MKSQALIREIDSN